MERNYYGNDYRIAELTYLNYIDPFEFEDLWNRSASYFTKTADDMYSATNKYKRFVISMLLRDNLSSAKWVIDEAAGRGGDLHRYQEIGVENTLFVDVDATAIAELIRRKFSVFAAKKRHVRDWFKKGGAEAVVKKYDNVHDVEYDQLVLKDVKSLTVHTLVADLKAPSADLIADTYQFGLNPGMVDGIVCNFAFHYMCDTVEHMRNLLMFNSRMLRVGGVFIFTVMNAASVFSLLENVRKGAQWESREHEVLKYAIRRDYTGDKLAATGQFVSVLLPFSDEMYSEPLCNVDTVIVEATRLGFSLEVDKNMTAMLDQFARADKTLSDKLTPDDIEYIRLHRYVSLRKIAEPKRV